MEGGNSSNQNSQPNFSSSQPNFSTSQLNFSSSQPSTQNFGYTPNFSFFPQVQSSQIPPNFQFPQFAPIFQNSQIGQASQFPFNIQGGQFSGNIQGGQFPGSIQGGQFSGSIQGGQLPGNMQFSQFSPFSTQSENDVTIIPPPTNSGSSRRTIWSIEDDKMLARAYYTISQDSKIGNEQSGPRFWKRVEEYYNANVGNDRPRRNVDRLKAHWGLIKRLTYDFHTIYCRLQGMRPSGANDADIIVRATEEFKLKHGRDKFGYEHVWAICKDLPSWQPSFVARQASLSKSSTNQTSSASGGGSVEGSGGGSVQGSEGGSEEVFPRPMGRNAAKRKAKERYTGKNDEDEFKEVLKKQTEMFERHLQMKLERDQRKEEELRMQQYNILMKDTSEMTEDQLATHLAYCKEIKKRLKL